MTLYDIDTRIAECFDPDTGEILDFAALESLQIAREEKIGNIGKAYRNYCAEVEAIDTEIKRLQAAKEAASKRKESCAEYLAFALNGKKYKDATISVHYRATTAIIIEDESKIPAKYFTEQKPVVSKSLIGSDLAAGKEVPGARFEKRRAVIIK